MRFIGNDLATLKRELADEFDRPPQGPALLYACASADLPDAADYPYGVVFVSDINLGIMVVSNGTAWIRQDTGAAV